MNKEVSYNPKTNSFNFVNKNSTIGMANLMWHITDKCLLNCPYCFSNKSNNEFDIDNLCAYIDIFKKIGVLKVDISGGEPLLYENLPQICEKLVQANIFFTITTSAFASKDSLDWLVKNSYLFARIIFSINGPMSDIHENINKGKKSFNNICEYSKKISEISNNVRINTVVTKEINSVDNIQEFVRLIHQIMPLEWCIIQQYNGDDESEKVYKSFVEKIKKLSFNNIKIIYRTKDIYNDYYVLQPNGSIFLRSKPFEKIDIKSLE